MPTEIWTVIECFLVVVVAVTTYNRGYTDALEAFCRRVNEGVCDEDEGT